MNFCTLKNQLYNRFYPKQVDILISKNQALQILYLKHITLHKLPWIETHENFISIKLNIAIYCTVLLLYYNSKQNIPYIGLALKNQSSSDNPVILAIERYWMTSCKSRL